MADRVRPAQRDGVLLLHKPKGPTSAWCVETVKRRLGQKKIGHAGTLDPMAEGLLVVMLGRATKIGPYLLDGEKTYWGRLLLGKTTDTYDAEGTVTAEAPWLAVTPSDVAREIAAWLDLESQEVPAFSAAKHQGKPLYALARQGMTTPVKTKPVRILEAEVLDVDLPSASFRVRVSSGVYIRSLVHSLGKRLGCGAVLTALIRERSSPFGLEQAHGLEALVAEPERFAEKVLPMTLALAGMPHVVLTGAMADKVRTGWRLPIVEAPRADPERETVAGDRALLLDPSGEALAVCQAEPVDGLLRWAILRGLW